jgi:hypothetical protein
MRGFNNIIKLQMRVYLKDENRSVLQIPLVKQDLGGSTPREDENCYVLQVPLIKGDLGGSTLASINSIPHHR